MLEITTPETELYDSENNLFISVHSQVLRLEHSLVSLYKWEKKHHKPFISKEKMSMEETIDYIKCMTITQNVDPMVYKVLSLENIEAVNKYIEDPMTATWFNEDQSEGKVWGKKKTEQITAEIIYYWMIALQIPMECQKWHLNSLLTLIQVCNIKNKPLKKTSMRDRYSRNRAINEARKAAMNTRG